MKSFLSQVAERLLELHGTSLSEIHVVVPTRRAVFFLKRELGTQISTPVVSPQIVAIEDFVSEVSGLQTTDAVNLLFALFDAFREVDEKVDFDRFMGWGAVLLSDFDRLDMALIKPEYLFGYLTEAKALERWNAEASLSRPLEMTDGTRHFFSLFENIRRVYTVFRSKLRDIGLAYPGMAYRHLAEHPGLLEDLQSETFYFAGFNAFTPSEMEIVKRLTSVGKGTVFWDSDAYYMTENTYLEAGRYMRRMKEKQLLGREWYWMGNQLATEEKRIQVYGVPNATLQTRVASRIYNDISLQQQSSGLTAIVLADESLLTPMLYALDGRVKDVNVTMGLPLRNSMIFTLVDAVFDLQLHLLSRKGKDTKINYRFIVKLLTHPFLRHYGRIRAKENRADFVELLAEKIRKENQVYLSEEYLLSLSGQDPLVKCLFVPWQAGNSQAVISSFYEIIDLLREVYRDHKSPAEQEYLYHFYTILGKFGQTLAAGTEEISLQALKQLLFELIRQNKIPFSGEPVSSLQIIGLLETRALDFENVIILSVNEGVLPAQKRQNSLIPFDIAREAGLPTHEHQDALSAYYFYRLLQRSKQVHLLYVNTHDGLGGGEKSRFLLQLEYEWPRYNSNVKIINHVVDWEKSGQVAPAEPELKKDGTVRQQLLDYLKRRGLYPTHIHTLLNSPFDFYLKHVLRMEEEKETEETVGMDKLGSWLHNSFEKLDRCFFLERKEPGSEDVDRVLQEEFTKLGGYETATGLNSLYYKVGAQQFREFMKEQHLKAGHRWPVATEQNLSATFTVTCNGIEVPVRLGGKIDRVELSDDGTLYVMDYKTGSVEVKSPAVLAKDIEGYLTRETDYKMNYVRQLWLYQYLVYREMDKPGGWRLGGASFRLDSHEVRSGFYSLRSPTKVTENPLVLTETGDARAYIRETERILGIVISGLLDPDLALVRTSLA